MDKILEQRINNGFWVVTEQHQQKSHTCEEGGARLRMAFIDELEKQIIIKKTVEGGQ